MSHPKALTAAEILAADDVRRELVEVPEWGGAIYLQSMTAVERDALEADVLGDAGGKDRAARLRNLRARVVAACAVDAGGQRLFAPEQVDALGRKNARVVDRLFDKASELSGIGQKEVDALAKKSEPSPSAGSTSG